MIPRIETLKEKKLVGCKIKTSFANNKTGELWRNFMPRRKEITNSIGTELYSMQIYPQSFYDNFNPTTGFEKYATLEVADFDKVPEGMETYILTEGQYAVFIHKGSNTDNRTFEYIFTTWLPTSEYLLDDRPHFEILGEKYKNNDANSEEEIWIPIKPKK